MDASKLDTFLFLWMEVVRTGDPALRGRVLDSISTELSQAEAVCLGAKVAINVGIKAAEGLAFQLSER